MVMIRQPQNQAPCLSFHPEEWLQDFKLVITTSFLSTYVITTIAIQNV